ncbi:MAG: S-methyl-5'-thioinosine phosphorylase [Pseudomonadales bacterium]|nr:S-methyl-5'-thioinosine phosphorylase [Pseudomonadales bacterium]
MLGIIGGSGWSKIAWLDDVEKRAVQTPYGKPSAPLELARYNDSSTVGNAQETVCFLGRHGEAHTIAPHKVNYRANVHAMWEAGVDAIIAINAVGACSAAFSPGTLVLPDQIIDYTYGREHTFFDTLEDFSSHVDFTEPFDLNLRQRLLACAGRVDVPLHDGGTYGCTQGPRFESAAEIRKIARDGCDLVGMTLMPEAALCRERGIPVASICMVVNPAAGVADGVISMADIDQAMAVASAAVADILKHYLAGSI